MVAKSGDRLLDDDGVQMLRAELLPLRPGRDAEHSRSGSPQRTADRLARGRPGGGARDSCARRRARSSSRAATRPGDEIVDLLFDGERFTEFRTRAHRHRTTPTAPAARSPRRSRPTWRSGSRCSRPRRRRRRTSPARSGTRSPSATATDRSTISGRCRLPDDAAPVDCRSRYTERRDRVSAAGDRH